MREAILYAATDDGSTLPVIDVTHPAFAVTISEAELATMSHDFVLESAQRQDVPAAVRDALQRSILGQAFMASSGGFLSGMHTYLLKVGPDNLGPDATPIDRRIAASFPALTTRLRLQDVARLLADSLRRTLAAHPGRTLCLINIAGGPAADSWNALIHLQAEHPDLLVGREVAVAVLDLDDHGPAFGGRAIAALRAFGAPLAGLDISFRHITYDWSEADALGQMLADVHAADSACAISSEGGLFEYGLDAAIIANLEQLHAGTGPDAVVVGSVTRDGEPSRSAQATNRFATRPRTIEALRCLTEAARWRLDHVLERPFSYNVRLAKS
jgi:hypothetical protein